MGQSRIQFTLPGLNKLKILIIRVADHRFKLEQKIGTHAQAQFCSDSMLIFLTGNRP